MRILNKLTLKHLMMNKKRTIVSIIGIVLSTAMMVGIGLLFSTLRFTMINNHIRDYGSHHVAFKNINGNDVETIEKNLYTKSATYAKNLGFSQLNDSINPDKPYINLVAGTNGFLSNLDLIQGRMPKNSNEVVISEHINTNGGVLFQIGDELNFELGYRFIKDEDELEYSNNALRYNYYEDENGNLVSEVKEESLVIEETKKVTVVGIVKRSYYEDYDASGYMMFTKQELIDEKALYDMYVTYRKPTKTFDYTKEIEKSLKFDKTSSVVINEGLLYYYGASKYSNFNIALYKVLSIVLSILSVGCAVVIYNSFAISTLERKKEFGLFTSVGTTKAQIQHTVFFEAFILGTLGIIIGTLSAFTGIFILIKIINELLKDVISEFIFSPDLVLILIPIIYMTFVIILSAFLPAKRSSKISPIELLRQNDDIKIKTKKLKTNKLIGVIFGIEGTIALKNIKRNKKRYRITIISLFISIVMFISFSSYLEYGIITSDSFDMYDYDVEVNIQSNNENVSNKLYNSIKSLDNIDDITSYESTNIVVRADKNLFTKDYYKFISDNDYISNLTTFSKNNPDFNPKNPDELYYKDTIAMTVIKLDERSYNNYIKENNFNKNDIIVLNKLLSVDYSNDQRVTSEFMPFNTDEKTIKVCGITFEWHAKNCDKDLNVKYTDKYPKNFKKFTYSSTPVIIVNEEKYSMLNQLNEYVIEEDFYYKNVLINSSNVDKLSEDIENIDLPNVTMYHFSPTLELKAMKNTLLVLKILLYGFISLIILIGITSVFNTINTSINLRKKEFAMLRSVGLTPTGFNKMLFFESMFFGMKSLLYAIPVSILLTLATHVSISDIYQSSIIIPYKAIFISIVGVFLIVLITMMYSARKIKHENILEAIRQENI